MNSNGISKRPALKVLTPEILNLTRKHDVSKEKGDRDRKEGRDGKDELLNVAAFVRERVIMQAARDANRRNLRAKRLGIPLEKCPPPDSVWRNYQNSSVRIEDFDLEACENDEILFEFAKEVGDQFEAAEIGPDDGIPINSSVTLPRSFLVDSIHLAASKYCLHLQSKTGNSLERLHCPSPSERAKSFEGVSERYGSTLKTLMKKTKKKWINNDDNDASSDSEDLESSEESDDQNQSSNDLDFDAILAHLLDTPKYLEPSPAYEYSDTVEYGADALWSFDTSSLLSFGVLAEEFVERMINVHLEYHENDAFDDFVE